MDRASSTTSVRPAGDHELAGALAWLVRIRWLAAAAVATGTAIARLAGLQLPQRGSYLIAVAIGGYNLLFWLVHRRLGTSGRRSADADRWFARIQIGADWIALTALISISGGVDSPALVFFLLHITVASLLLPHDRTFPYVTVAVLLIAGVAALEAGGVLHHVSLVPPPRYTSPLYVGVLLTLFACVSYGAAYLAASVARRLRRREGEISALYDSVRAATSTLDLSAVLERLAEATTRVLGCQGAGIRLLDPGGTRLVAAASCGLSESFMSAVLDLNRSAIDRQALVENKALFIDAINDPRIVYPEANRQEGIHTILVAPLVGKAAPIGVLRAYGGEGHHFDRADADFLLAVAAQGANAIENAQAYEKLASLDRDKSQFVRTFTHELRSPVQVSQSLLALLEQGFVGALTGEQADLVGRARRRIEFLQTLVDDLLDLAAGKAGLRPTREPRFVDLALVLQEVGTRFAPAARAKGLQLRLEIDAGTLVVRGDGAQIDRILNNLVANAIRYTPHGQVCLHLAREAGMARVTVSDTGIGIPADAMPHLFEEFFRAPNAKAIEEHGTGLGLAIVKGLVETYQGTISVDSRTGDGATFVVRLPIAADSDLAAT